MEKIDLRREYIAKLKKEGEVNVPEEYYLTRNQNYSEWLELKLLIEVESKKGLFVTDKQPETLFRNIFVDLIEEIDMDGEKTFSPVDFEYYEEYFKRGIKLLMWQIH